MQFCENEPIRVCLLHLTGDFKMAVGGRVDHFQWAHCKLWKIVVNMWTTSVTCNVLDLSLLRYKLQETWPFHVLMHIHLLCYHDTWTSVNDVITKKSFLLFLQAVESLRTIAAEHSSQDLENHFVPLVKRLSQGLYGFCCLCMQFIESIEKKQL